jgi:hypothetical protein
MVSNPVQGIRHPRVGIDICLLAGSKKGIHFCDPLCPWSSPLINGLLITLVKKINKNLYTFASANVD